MSQSAESRTGKGTTSSLEAESTFDPRSTQSGTKREIKSEDTDDDAHRTLAELPDKPQLASQKHGRGDSPPSPTNTSKFSAKRMKAGCANSVASKSKNPEQDPHLFRAYNPILLPAISSHQRSSGSSKAGTDDSASLSPIDGTSMNQAVDSLPGASLYDTPAWPHGRGGGACEGDTTDIISPDNDPGEAFTLDLTCAANASLGSSQSMFGSRTDQNDVRAPGGLTETPGPYHADHATEVAQQEAVQYQKTKRNWLARLKMYDHRLKKVETGSIVFSQEVQEQIELCQTTSKEAHAIVAGMDKTTMADVYGGDRDGDMLKVGEKLQRYDDAVQELQGMISLQGSCRS